VPPGSGWIAINNQVTRAPPDGFLYVFSARGAGFGTESRRQLGREGRDRAEKARLRLAARHHWELLERRRLEGDARRQRLRNGRVPPVEPEYRGD